MTEREALAAYIERVGREYADATTGPGRFRLTIPPAEYLADRLIAAGVIAAGVHLGDEGLREALTWRDENDWYEAIRKWLGPQCLSLYLTKDVHTMAKGAVMAAAILARADLAAEKES